MALVFAESVCGLCKKRVVGTAFFATSGVFLPPEDPLHPLCDAALHADCVARWSERRRFARAYFEQDVDYANPRWTVVFDDDELHVRVNPASLVDAVQVTLASLVVRPRVPLREWDEWLAAEPQGRHAIELDAMRDVWGRLRMLGSADVLRERAHRPLEGPLLARVEHHRARGLRRAWGREVFACPVCKAKPCALRWNDRISLGEASTASCSRCDHALTVDELSAPFERERRRRQRLR